MTFAFIAITLSRELSKYSLLGLGNIWMWTYLGIPKNVAQSLKSAFSSINQLSPLLAGVIADAWLGKKLTCAIFFNFNVIFPIFIAIAMLPQLGGPIKIGEEPHMAKAVMWFVGYGISALSQGVMAIEQSLGADQFDEDDLVSKNLFFTLFYAMVQVSSLMTFFLPTIILEYPYAGFGCFLGCFVVGVLVDISYFAGYKNYRQVEPEGSVLLDAIRAFFSAAAKAMGCGSSSNSHGDIEDGQKQPTKKGDWLDQVKIENGGKFSAQLVEDVRQIGKLLVWTALMVIGWMGYDQGAGVVIQQGVQMDDRGLNANSVQAFLDPLLFLVGTALQSFVLMPLYKKKTGKDLSAIARMWGGNLLICISMACYAGIEYWRLSTPIFQDTNESGDFAPKHELSIWVWVIPQLFMSFGEVGLFIGQTEFFYNEAPAEWKTVAVAIGTFLSASIASWIEIIFTQSLGDWIPTNLDEGRFADYMWIFCGLLVLDVILLIVYQYFYTKKYTWSYSNVLAERQEAAGEPVKELKHADSDISLTAGAKI